jgi:hypothetical protein
LVRITVIIDDAGSGDLLFGVVIGAYRSEDQDFRYDVVDVQYFQSPKFDHKEYLKETSRIVSSLLDKLELRAHEPIMICSGNIFDVAVKDLIKKYGADHIRRIKVVGEPQLFTETAYLDEIRNLGYEPLQDRDDRRAQSFFHMMRWLMANQRMMKYAKTGWPRLSRYAFFRAVKTE